MKHPEIQTLHRVFMSASRQFDEDEALGLGYNVPSRESVTALWILLGELLLKHLTPKHSPAMKDRLDNV